MCCDYHGPRPTGGAERVTVEVLGRWADAGLDVTLLSATPHAPRGVSTVLDPRGFRVVRCGARDLSAWLGGQAAVSAALPTALRRELRALRPAAVVTHSLHFQGSLTAALLAPRSGAPLVTTVHVGDTDALAGPVRRLLDLEERTVGRFILGRSDAVIAVSDDVAFHCRDLGADPASVRTVPNGVDLQRFRPGPAPDPNSPPVVLFLGRLIGNKGPDTALAAFERLRRSGLDARLRLVGDGPERRRLEAMVRGMEHRDDVELVGAVDDPERHLAGAAVLVRPSRTEGMSLALLEAMAAGVPVVASDIPANRELLGDGGGRLVPVGDPDALARAVAGLLADPAARQRVARAGRVVAECHSWDRTAHDTLEVVADVVGRASRHIR